MDVRRNNDDHNDQEGPSLCEMHHVDNMSLAAAGGMDDLEDEVSRLTWRSRPSDNFSDWTIKVKAVPITSPMHKNSNHPESAEKEVIATYHVHRNILALGERRSGYFANLFLYGIDDGDRCTNVEVCDRAATHFPYLLDYMYGSRGFAVSTSNAVPLLFLSQSLQVTSLLGIVENFIERDVRKLYNFGAYLSEALYFSDPRIASRVRDTGGTKVLQLTLCNTTDAGTLSKLLLSPLSSSASQVGEQCQTMWFFLTRFPRRLAARASRRTIDESKESLSSPIRNEKHETEDITVVDDKTE